MADPAVAAVLAGGIEEEDVVQRPPNPINEISASITSVGLLAKRVLSSSEKNKEAKVFGDSEQLALSLLVSIHALQKKPKDLPYKVSDKMLSELTDAGENVYSAVVVLMETARKFGGENQDPIKQAYADVKKQMDEIMKVIDRIEEGEDDEDEKPKKKGKDKDDAAGEGGYNMQEIQKEPGLHYIFKLATHIATMISTLQEDHKLAAEEVLEKAKERESAVNMLITLTRKFARCRADGEEQKLLLDTATKTKTASTDLLAAQKAVLSRPDSKPDHAKYVSVAEEFSSVLLKLLQLLIQIKSSDVKTSHRLYIWDETDDKNITMENGIVSAGSLNQLIIRLTNPSGGNQNAEFRAAFLATFPTFTNADELFTKLVHRFKVPRRKFPDDSYDKWRNGTVMPLQKKVLRVLEQWMTERFTDFSYSLIKRLNDFVESDVFPAGYEDEGKRLYTVIQRNIEALHKAYVPIVQPLKKDFKISEYLLELGPKALAEQLAVREFSDFKRIRLAEFLDLNWKNPKLKHRSPNVSKILEQNKILSDWVTHVIVTTTKLKKRVDVYSKMVNLAQTSFHLHNYSSCKAVVLGLSNPAVDRLKFTKAQAPIQTRSTLISLQERLRPDDSHAKLQQIMKTDKLPVIPYLPVVLENLAQVEEGNADKVGNLINFKKRADCYAVLKEVKRFQGAEVPIPKNEQTQSVLENLSPVVNVSGKFFYEQSLEEKEEDKLKKK
eukprot:CAMPEP_0201514106 /NCGR_PEP_ID=MMETSP0161_2-20130828/6019_1 /ASSEMBLY_ACC=CAM_ASM_000251 /TAXON_ID=180227 /ORGANISM="Neoparamoeba aestuarina, Strain SoJaBio B1-5/56/2" /LENGTH=721 /DNA_ID=CAMNT_0047910561 /DNA_START=94 /DNA_END=2260 /DNA_ORIENTATION=+